MNTQVAVTIDWEGEHFNNIADLRRTRNNIGADIPVSHFICPAYYYRLKGDITAQINTVVLPKDEVHLHLHCYKELVEACGVRFKSDKNYYNVDSFVVDKLRRSNWFPSILLSKISGRGVPLTVYSKIEQRKIIEFSLNKLKQEFPDKQISGFRAGGNIINNDTIDILNELGFAFDSSATAPEIYSKGFTESNIGSLLDDYGDKTGVFTKYLIDLWGGKIQSEYFLENSYFFDSKGDKPQKLNSQPFMLNGLLELPENCGMTDFASPEESALLLLEELKNQSKQSEQTNYMQYGCHNEGDVFYKKQLVSFIVEARNYDVEFVGMSEVC